MILDEFNSKYFKNNLREVVGEIIDSMFCNESGNEETYVESFSDLF